MISRLLYGISGCCRSCSASNLRSGLGRPPWKRPFGLYRFRQPLSRLSIARSCAVLGGIKRDFDGGVAPDTCYSTAVRHRYCHFFGPANFLYSVRSRLRGGGEQRDSFPGVELNVKAHSEEHARIQGWRVEDGSPRVDRAGTTHPGH